MTTNFGNWCARCGTTDTCSNPHLKRQQKQEAKDLDAGKIKIVDMPDQTSKDIKSEGEWENEWSDDLIHAVAHSEWPSKGYKDFVRRLVLEARRREREEVLAEMSKKLDEVELYDCDQLCPKCGDSHGKEMRKIIRYRLNELKSK